MAADNGDTVNTDAWDEFWAEVNAKGAPTEVIRGVEVAIPSDLPLGFQQRVNELKDSTADEDVRELVALIFGEGILDRWIAAGMGAREFQVVCGWGIANGGGKPTSFREAYDMVTAAAAEGKAPGELPAPNRAARRAGSKKPSSAGGASSKRTSRASTGSVRTTSRT
jgi:hypothetical protein